MDSQDVPHAVTGPVTVVESVFLQRASGDGIQLSTVGSLLEYRGRQGYMRLQDIGIVFLHLIIQRS